LNVIDTTRFVQENLKFSHTSVSLGFCFWVLRDFVATTKKTDSRRSTLFFSLFTTEAIQTNNHNKSSTLQGEIALEKHFTTKSKKRKKPKSTTTL